MFLFSDGIEEVLFSRFIISDDEAITSSFVKVRPSVEKGVYLEDFETREQAKHAGFDYTGLWPFLIASNIDSL